MKWRDSGTATGGDDHIGQDLLPHLTTEFVDDSDGGEFPWPAAGVAHVDGGIQMKAGRRRGMTAVSRAIVGLE